MPSTYKSRTPRKAKTTSVSKSRSLREVAEFWDSHDAADYSLNRVGFEVDVSARQHYVAVDPDLLAEVRQAAHARGLTAESLVNLWLKERVQQVSARAG